MARNCSMCGRKKPVVIVRLCREDYEATKRIVSFRTETVEDFLKPFDEDHNALVEQIGKLSEEIIELRKELDAKEEDVK